MAKQKVGYVDGFVFIVPKKNVARYKKMASEASTIWMKYGALGFKECKGDDMFPDMGGYPVVRFPKLVKVKPSETVWFSYIEFKNKAHRNQVNKKVMSDPAMGSPDPDHMKNMPFDIKKMAMGGFTVEVSS